jgi:hypothetical protein
MFGWFKKKPSPPSSVDTMRQMLVGAGVNPEHAASIGNEGSQWRDVERKRHAAFEQWVRQMGIPGGVAAANALSNIWATLGEDDSFSAGFYAERNSLEADEAHSVLEGLHQTGVLARGVNQEGIALYKLSPDGARIGQRIAHEWRVISEQIK